MNQYRAEIDGLRAVAIVGVVLYHANFKSIGQGNVVPGGYIGVDVFFVISGYLITRIILRSLLYSQFSYLHFYARRARRIIPLLLLVVAATIPAAWFYLSPDMMKDYIMSLMSSLLFGSNFFFWLGDPYWASENISKPLLHTWSLAVEEQFYLFIPILLATLVSKYNRYTIWMIFMMASASFVVACITASNNHTFAFYLLPARAWELLAGAILADLEIRGFRNCKNRFAPILCSLGLILIIGSFFLFSEDTLHPSWLTLFPVGGSMLIIWFAQSDQFVTKLLGKKVFVTVGVLSYGIYLWHYPVFSFARMESFDLSNIVICTLIGGVILLSWTTHRLIEVPFRDTEKTTQGILIVYFTVVGACITAFSILGYADGFKSRFPEFLNIQVKPEKLENGTWLSNGSGDLPGIVLMGDSHMMAIEKEMFRLSKQNDHAFMVFNLSGCQMILDVVRLRKSDLTERLCYPNINRDRLNLLKNSEPSYVVIGGRLPLILEETRFDNLEGGFEGEMKDTFQNTQRNLVSARDRREYVSKMYQKTVKEILLAGHKVVLVYPIPEVGKHVPKYLLSNVGKDVLRARLFAEKFPLTTSYDVFVNRTKSSYRLLDSLSGDGLLRVYPEKIFCNSRVKNRCVTHDADSVYYRDDDHLSEEGARLLSTEIFDVINKSTEPDLD